MAAAQELTVRQAARRAGRSEETIRRWIWSGRLPAVKRGTSYRIDLVHLEQIMVEAETSGSGDHPTSNQSMLDWLDEVAEWKRGMKSTPGISAVDMLLEARRGRR